MIIKKLGIRNFGKFINKDITFEDGINVIYGKNEHGKTTIHQFIESFFPAKKNGFNQDVKKYFPWEGGGQFNGELAIDFEEKRYLLKADYDKDTLEVLEDNQKVVVDEHFNQQTYLNLVGVQDIGDSNSKTFIREIQNKIVNIKNANGMVIHYEAAVKDLEERIISLKEDAYYLKIEEDLAFAQEKRSQLIGEIHHLHEHVDHLYALRRKLKAYLDTKGRLQDSLIFDEHEQLTKRRNRIDVLNNELSELEDSINGTELFNHNSMEEVDAYIEDIKELNQLNRQVEEHSGQIEALRDKQKNLGLMQSEKAVKLMAEDMYANDFIMDVENYIRAEEELDKLEASIDEDAFKNLQIAAEDAAKAEKELEDDYFKFLNTKNKLSQAEQGINNDHEIITNETKLEMIEKRSKPLSIYAGVSVVLLVVSLLSILVLPQYMMVEAVLAILFGILTLVFIMNKFKGAQEINQLKFQIDQLEEEQFYKKEEIASLTEEIKQLSAKYGMTDSIGFEQNYLRLKKEAASQEDPKLKIIHIENEINELTANKNMLYRRVRKWILDSELDDQLKVEDREAIIPKVEAHSKSCVAFMNINNDIFRFEYMVRQNTEAIKAKKEAISSKAHYDLLRTMTLEEVIRTKQDFELLKSKHEQVSEDVNTLLEQLSYEKLSEKIEKKEIELKGLNPDLRIPGTKDELLDQLNETNESISVTRSDIQKNREIISDLSVSKHRLVDVNRQIVRLEEILKDRELKAEQAKSALSAIEKASEFIRESYTGELTEAIGKVLSQLTGVYDEVKITKDYEFFIRNKKKGRSVSINQLSRGLLDQLYFAVRLGLMDTVNKNDATPLVLDDTFVHYDDERLQNSLGFISKLDRQIIILTCQKRERTFLDEMNIPFNLVKV